ncbi:MAG: SIS domain-containing protein [Polyangiales bacterium]
MSPPQQPDVGTGSDGAFFERELADHQRVLARLVADDAAVLQRITDAVVAVFRRGNKLLFCGNGGSAADAQHVAAEFINRFRFERAALPAIALTVDSSVLTCIGNDSGFDRIFSRQVEALAQAGDALVAISTSGRSPNVILALEAARAKSALTIGFTGAAGVASMGALCDLCLVVPSTDTARIQEAHEFALHCIADLVERTMFTPPRSPTSAD